MTKAVSSAVRLSQYALWAGPICAALVYWLLNQTSDLPEAAAITAALTILCAIWWVFEPIPIPVTGLLPLTLLPLLDVLESSHVASAYGHPLILLMLGGAMLSKAMAASGAHQRIAVGLIRLSGGQSGFKVILGFMLAAALLSMWISNTATALMLLPVALAVLQQANPALTIPLLLSIAYGCSIGGLGTPIGTPPNMIFLTVLEETTGQTIGFLSWMAGTLPLVAVFIPLAAWWLSKKISTFTPIQLPANGPLGVSEKRVLALFVLTALAWVTMSEPYGGWKAWLDVPHANYGSVALLAVVLLFVIPGGQQKRLLTWHQARDIEWGVLLLFAGGIALAKAFMISGLSDALASHLTILTTLPTWLTILCICLSVTFLTEVTSNTATATLLMPILASAALALNVEPALLMLPAALSASCAFMMPVATPPNAIVFSSEQLHVQHMVKAGFVLNLLGSILITLTVLVLHC